MKTPMENIRFENNALTVACRFASNGKLLEKTEMSGGKSDTFAYGYDAKGRLEKVARNGALEEAYRYNAIGQRVRRQITCRHTTAQLESRLEYDAQGKLAAAGETTFTYNADGALASRRDSRGVTRFFYGADTMLDKAVLPSGDEIRYEYDSSNPTGLARRFKNNGLSAEYTWFDPIRLAAFADYERQLEYSFAYTEQGTLHALRIVPLARKAPAQPEVSDWAAHSAGWLDDAARRIRQPRLDALLAQTPNGLKLLCGCDQVGTLKLLTDANGNTIKSMEYDRFGVLRHDSLPDLFVPVGFAGGLPDKDTAPDPLGDTGGDHDLYDYCVDDPVSFVDHNGLKEKKVWQKPNFIQKMFWAVTLPNNHPYKLEQQEYTRRIMEQKTRGLAGGLQDFLYFSTKIPTGLPGPSDEQWKETKARWDKNGKDLKK